MLFLVQLSKCKATDAEKLLSQWEESCLMQFKSKAQVHEKMFLSHEWNVYLQCRRQISMY